MSTAASLTSVSVRRDGVAWLVAALVIAIGVVVAETTNRALFRPATFTVAFLAGLVTGSHCIGMCGGFVACYASRWSRGIRAHATYASAKTASYMLIGGLCGEFGHAVAANGRWPGMAALGAGAFLLVAGVYLIASQFWPSRWRVSAFDSARSWLHDRARHSTNPVAVGLVNGLMFGCGPLLAMYATAAGTGSAWQGSLLLGAFGLGTLPLMLASAWFASSIAARFQRQLARWSGPLVLIAAGLMLQRGAALTKGTASMEISQQASSAGAQIIRMAATAEGWAPADFTVREGVPVRWIIDGRHASICTARLRVPWLDHPVDVTHGETVIEFTPQQRGELSFSCWMGMARGHLTVVRAPPAHIAAR